MSPLSVAQFLPAEIKAFDLVVFDEELCVNLGDDDLREAAYRGG
jgi:hypothetical protein